MMLVLRIIHIGMGVFWAGTLIFLAFYLSPAMGRAGPAGGAVMQELQRAKLMVVMPIVALITILSGAWIMWILSGGFSARFFATRYGITLSIGAVASVVAFGIGYGVMRPAQARLGELGARLAGAEPEERGRLAGEMGPLRARVGWTSRLIAWLLIVAVVTMAAARYV
jgi:hypothetical protein